MKIQRPGLYFTYIYTCTYPMPNRTSLYRWAEFDTSSFSMLVSLVPYYEVWKGYLIGNQPDQQSIICLRRKGKYYSSNGQKNVYNQCFCNKLKKRKWELKCLAYANESFYLICNYFKNSQNLSCDSAVNHETFSKS
jgi:hypothetical protein